jgi:hypothetical protein
MPEKHPSVARTRSCRAFLRLPLSACSHLAPGEAAARVTVPNDEVLKPLLVSSQSE